MRKPRAGLLPMYLELYDKSWPRMRPKIDGFYKIITAGLEKQGVGIITAPVCRIKSEFSHAVAEFEKQKADAIVTVHLSYSPSLESIDVLTGSRLPLIVLDTTPSFEFGPDSEEDEILYNHGIHGVQDLCSLLVRRGKSFFIEAGHWKESDVLERAAEWVTAAMIAFIIKKARVGRMGNPFPGMGDFLVSDDTLRKTIGIDTRQFDFSESPRLLSEIDEGEITAELEKDRSLFDTAGIGIEIHRKSVIAGLAARRWIKKEKLTAFTINFMAIDKASGIPCMPFLEASKAMARGTGYAGEGDVLTAALMGALAPVFPETTFIEMFCPDWKNSSIFISHMGEMNMNLAAEKPRLMEKDFPFTDAGNPAVACGRFKPGRGVFVNLAPGPEDTYALIVSPAEMLAVAGSEDKLENSIRGWFRPAMPVSDFLTAYSKAGGTHHAVFVYGAVEGIIAKFGRIIGWKTIEIGQVEI